MNDNILKAHQLISNAGLYSPIDISEYEEADLIEFVSNLDNLEEGIDLFCPHCKKETVFRNSHTPDLSGTSSQIGNLRVQIKSHPEQILRHEAQLAASTPQTRNSKHQQLKNYREHLARWKVQERDLLLTNRFFSLELMCARDNKHKVCFIFRKNGDEVEKIGQYPSIADLKQNETKRYKSLLTDNQHGDLTRAVGLYSHGIGVGSFIYLRRVFESLLEEAHQILSAKNIWDKEKYNNGRIQDRIKMLKAELPEFLVKHAKIYSVLSDGVHNLSEEECLSYFEPIYRGITLILDEKLAQNRRLASIEEASKAIKAITPRAKK